MSAKSLKVEERAEAIAQLHKYLKPGDTIYTKVLHVSRSGMQRVIAPIICRDGEPWSPWGYVARAINGTPDRDKGGVKAEGCGMDMGFNLVYTISMALYPSGFGCIGEGCPSNDHSNGDRSYPVHGLPTGCREPVCVCHDPGSWTNPTSYPNGCSWCGCHRAEHWHAEGGYALRQRWL